MSRGGSDSFAAPRLFFPLVAVSDRHQAIKEGTVMLECNPEIFGRNIVTVAPLFFEVCTLYNKTLLDLFKRFNDEVVCILNGFVRLIDEICLDAPPLRAKRFRLPFRDQRLDCTAPALEWNDFGFLNLLVSFMRLV